MYSLMLVDDELPILNGLYNNIAWEESGFSNVYKADSALLALEMASQHRIDVVVTDISMPEMDGLAMCERIRAIWPMCRIVLLTGFRDFEYARRAVDIGVYQYLVKPVRYEDLQSVVAGALEELQQDLEQTKLLDRAKEKLRELGSLMSDRCLNSWLIQGSITPETDEIEMREAGIDISADMFGFSMILKWHDRPQSAAVLQLGILELIRRLMPECERIYPLHTRHDEMLVVFLFRDRAAAETFYIQCCSSLDVLQISVQRSANCTLSIFVSRIGGAVEMKNPLP